MPSYEVHDYIGSGSLENGHLSAGHLPNERSFENSFWGKDDRGVEALMNKMRKAKQTCAELRSVLAARASLEEDYGKKLIKLSKTDFCKDETGDMQKALSRLRTEFEATGNAHIDLSQRMKTDLDNNLANFISNQRERRKAQAAVIERSSKSKSLKHANLLKIKEKYLNEKAKANNYESSSSNASKELEKAQIRQYKMKELEQEYTRLSSELEEATRIWQHDWRVSCRLFQELEEERIDFIKKISWDYSNIIAATCLKDDESCERIRTALQNIQVDQEIQAFIEERGTGYDPDYETDGSPMYEIPSLDSPIETGGGSVFSMTSPASFIKKAFHRPHSFASNSSLFGTNSGSSSKSKLSAKRQSSAGKQSHEDLNYAANNCSHHSVNDQQNPNYLKTDGSKGSLVSFYNEDTEAASKIDNIVSGTNFVASPQETDHHHSPSDSRLDSNRTDDMNFHKTPEISQITAPPTEVTTNATIRPLFFVRVIYDYLREMELEMTINTGQVIAVLATHDDGWWEGEFVDPSTGIATRGIFPSNFTKRID